MDTADLADAVARLTPPQHAAAMNAIAEAHQTGDVVALVATLVALAEE